MCACVRVCMCVYVCINAHIYSHDIWGLFREQSSLYKTTNVLVAATSSLNCKMYIYISPFFYSKGRLTVDKPSFSNMPSITQHILQHHALCNVYYGFIKCRIVTLQPKDQS